MRKLIRFFIAVGSWPYLISGTFGLAKRKLQLIKINRNLRVNLSKKSKKNYLSLLAYVSLVVIGFTLCFFILFLPYWVYQNLALLPNPKLLTLRDIPVSTKIYDRNGILLYQIYADEKRTMVELSDLPKYVLEATIASEDKNFYHHLGVDPVGIIRAAWANYRNSGVIQGGSTITQQLIKSTLLSPERSVSRKIKEIILAFWAERIYNKEEILKMYLNQIPYGGAAYGIEEAAKTYFNKPAKELTLAEATLLAGLPSSPSTYSPFGPHPELAKNRQIQVIQNMLDQGYIDPITANQIKDAPLLYNNIETSIKSPHFVMFVKDYLIKNYGVRAVERGGLEVKTTLDYRLYEATQKILRDGVIRQKYLNVGNGAVLITNPNTGEILTMIGSVDFFDTKNDGNVNVTLANRSPGSAIKPLNYGLAF